MTRPKSTQHKTELEKVVAESEVSPISLLGVEPWVLRSLPSSLRMRFLREYKAAIQKTHHPDLYTNPSEKKTHETYVQRVSAAVNLFVADPMTLDLALDDLRTIPSAHMQLHKRISQLETDLALTERTLKEVKDQKVPRINTIQTVRDYEQRTLLQDKHLEPWGSFTGTIYVQPVSFHLGKPEEFVQALQLERSQISERDYPSIEKNTQKIIADQCFINRGPAFLHCSYIKGVFQQSIKRRRSSTLEFIGGVSYVGLREFILQEFFDGEYRTTSEGSPALVKHALEELTLNVPTYASAERDAYERKVLPYMFNAIKPGMLCLMQRKSTFTAHSAESQDKTSLKLSPQEHKSQHNYGIGYIERIDHELPQRMMGRGDGI